ncbi:MAG TPA: hypothetical protein VF080_12400 [Solirubrobacteraceae bacterium]
MSEQPQAPESPDHDPREAGFGPGEDGESIEEGRPSTGEQGEKDDDDES